KIAATYKRLRKLQDKKVEMQVASEQFNRSQQRGYDKLRDEIVGYVKSLSLNNARIESLVEQLYSINKRLVAHESRLMRLADSFGVPHSISSTSTSATSSTRPGSTAWRRPATRYGSGSSGTSASKSTRFAPTFTRWLRKRGLRSPNTAASSRPCKRASARRARP